MEKAIIFLPPFSGILGTESRASCILEKHSTTELQLHPQILNLKKIKMIEIVENFQQRLRVIRDHHGGTEGWHDKLLGTINLYPL